MSVATFPAPERIPIDPKGVPEGHWAGQQLATTELLNLLNEALPDIHLNRQDADWIAHNMIKQYLSRLVRVR